MASKMPHVQAFAAVVSLMALSAACQAQTASQGGTAQPDDSEDGAVGEIVVTAQRRGESIQKVPISISAFTQATLDRQGVRDIQDIVRLTPGLNFSRGGQQGLTNISIRGIRSNGGASTTGIYLDDVPLQVRRAGYSGGSPFPLTFDLERVEVLRGPQGTLFGAGSQGGTIRFITPAPSLTDFSAYGRAEITQTKYGGVGYEIGAAAGGPLVEDKVGIRASAWYRKTAGWIDRVDPRTGAVQDTDVNTGNAFVGRLAIALAPTEGILITPSIYFQREHSDDVNSYWGYLSSPKQGRYISGNELASPNTDKFYIPSLNISAELGEKVSLVSVTSYLHRDQNAIADYTAQGSAIILGTPIPIPGNKGPNLFDNSQRSFTQEVRLQSTDPSQKLRWVAGAFYQNTRQNASQFAYDPFIASLFGSPAGDLVFFQDPFRTKDTQIAGFAQADLDVLPGLTTTVGLRVSNTKFSFETTTGGPFAGPTFNDSGRQSETPVTPKFGLEYRFDPDSSVYASVSKGYRVGGSNARQLAVCGPQLASLGLAGINPTRYDSDTVWSYEIGSKNRLFDRKLQVNGSLFYVNWNNIQQFVTLASCGGGFLANLGRAVSKGFDLEVSASPAPGLNLGLAAGYTHGEFKDTVFAAGPVPGQSAVSRGDRIQGSPWRISANAEYRHQVSDSAEVYGRVDYQFASQEPANVAQTNPTNGLNFIPQYFGAAESHFVALRAGVKLSRVDVSLFIDNLTNTTAILDGQNQNNTFLTRFSGFRPRTIGLTSTLRY